MSSRSNQKKIFMTTGLILCVLAGLWGAGDAVQAKPLLGGFDCAISQSVISTADCVVLVTLYADTDGAGSWFDKTNWFTSDPCTWYGITCGAGTPRPVTLIKLNANNLIGTIPANLGTLTSLTYLGLASNTLTGTIPPELGNMTSLEGLVLNNNSLGGTLPQELGNLSNLDNLEIPDNSFYGRLPQNLSNLPLTTLRYDGTSLCEPQNSTFQSWLASLISYTGTGVPCELFIDEFETGDFSLWSRFNDGNGYLYPCHAAAINGSWGACVDRGTDKRKQLIDETPVCMGNFKVRFNIDMNSLWMAEGTRFRFMQVKMGAERPFFLVLRRLGGQYQFQLNLLLEDRTKVKSGWHVLSDAPHTIEIEWAQASDPLLHDGWAMMFLDDVMLETFPAVDNPAMYVDTFKIGFTSRLDGKAISGIFYLDDVATSNLYHIGLP